MSNRSSSSNVNSVFYAERYHPIQTGSIDGTDILPHDSAVYRALLCSSAGLYDPFGDPKVTGDPYCSLFVGRLSPFTTEDTLIKAMERYGKVKNIRLVTHIVTGASRGYAFVEFDTEREMRRAYEEAHHTTIDNSEIIVDYNRQQLMPGWIPRRLGGGLGGKKESGQLRFGGRERPFRAPLRPIPYDDLKRLGIPPPPEGKYNSRFQVPSPPRRNGGCMERKNVQRERSYEEHLTKRYSGDREYSNRRSIDRERHSHRQSRRYNDEHSQERDGYEERSPRSKKRRSLDRERSTRNSRDRELESLSDSEREEELSHRKRPKYKDEDTSRRRTGDGEEHTHHRWSKDEEHSTRRSKHDRTSSSRRPKEHREHSQKRHKHSSTKHRSKSQDSPV